ncbi:DUF885 domain-containing protein [Eleftheria terrae]|uniref:DUF885 domain-containing protein n=1 Tax=Eleftheria terrae TaxID=1597781 RepID=UPI00263AFB71|nr:DUF885 family protein [Eleftheria terrae]WKB50635.1 DUF885 family protein [Eleftheria terrae]
MNHDPGMDPFHPHPVSRRQWLQRSGAWCAAAALAACTAPRTPTPASALNRQLDALLAQWLADAPHEATAQGLDLGQHRALRSRWADRSLAAAQAGSARNAEALARLDRLPRAGLDASAAATLDAVRFALELAVEGAAFGYGDQGLVAMLCQENTPYAINQMLGLALNAPPFLASHQPLRTPQDLDAWLARLAALPAQIDHETERFRHDAARGVLPPRFVLATLLDQLDGLLATPPAASRPLAALRASAPGTPGALAQAGFHWERGFHPAVQRQRDAVHAAMARARDEAGVCHLPDGERYYAWALRVGTTTARSAAEVHRIGLARSAEIGAEMDRLLRSQGLAQGSVGERMRALGRAAQHGFQNTDAGREAALTLCRQWVVRFRAAMPRWSALPLRAPLAVERVPVEVEAGAAGAYLSPGSLDGSREATFYLNLRDTAQWPRWALPTLVAHETLPGHVWQEANEAELARRHPIHALLKFNGYSEGWALYAEQLVDEARFYDDDPLARLGYLQAQQLRATRLVVDTGLHALGWSRERAIQAMADATGRPRGALEGEVDRYCVKPGQACGYMIGQAELLRLRTQWRNRRGSAGGDVRFNDAVLRAGNLPLAVLAPVLQAA